MPRCLSLQFWEVVPHDTLTGRGSRVYPNVWAAGCTLKVGAAGCTLTSGQPVAAWSGQEMCSGFALARRGLLYELVQYNLYKKCTNCMNLYYTICIKNVRII